MAHVLACARYPVAKLFDLLPPKYIEALEQNQQIASCCRHPEDHEIEAFYSSENWRDKKKPDGSPDPAGGVPDIYIFHCTCGKQHRRFCVGGGDVRPYWEVA
ncbi:MULTISPECIES: hypothetical protein [unclassified Mesorhizobium]|uniref:hypothetical protein n=1 Tax=unclassified Mesorhizobium TaxID=325217 RepID=UPI0003CECD66|nr:MULTISPECIES: hypothetical protein [unclassified Mesorhizobium]ESY49027.1 hypothetical protein X745_28020 [Mesorhizobium sp. LNJC374B00]ESY52735.1 hypothetical protein X744_28580 [Mesorhizobium sp. LNJC372A00]WJI81457.1 hypothetical protein NLY34_01470 [Mesorhizobium sp. C374B]WJI87976.1 hypothetical protein NLY42_03885 [Mesorhizobium sp. C372A]